MSILSNLFREYPISTDYNYSNTLTVNYYCYLLFVIYLLFISNGIIKKQVKNILFLYNMNENIGNEDMATLTETHKDLDNSIQCVLDPLSVIIKLAILSNKPVGTKLLIKDNVVYFQEPGMFQSFCRKLYNSNKNDIQYLYNPIHKACSYFLSKNHNGTNVERLSRIKKLFICAQNGLKKLMETYRYSNIIVITLN